MIALGKLGGRELNYSSDIDLMFIYSGDDTAEAMRRAKEFFKRAANRMTDMLSTYTDEGMCYRVDLRLRPDGRFGEVCHSLEGAKQYYATRGRDWELQMLIKARVAAGDPRPGPRTARIRRAARSIKTTTDFRTVEAVSETAPASTKSCGSTGTIQEPAGVDVKLAQGGIRDIEFLVQCLQRLHGGREPWVRHGGTLLALSRLRDKDCLSPLGILASRFGLSVHASSGTPSAVRRRPPDPYAPGTKKDKLDLLARKMPRSPASPAPARSSANSITTSPACRIFTIA